MQKAPEYTTEYMTNHATEIFAKHGEWPYWFVEYLTERNLPMPEGPQQTAAEAAEETERMYETFRENREWLERRMSESPSR